MEDGDVTQWLGQLARGDDFAAQQIWERYYEQLVRLARNKLRDSRRREADEEDVVLSAFNSFCQGAAAARFPRLHSRNDLWKLLVTITARKAVSQLRREHAEKRGGGAVRGESIFVERDPSEQDGRIADVVGREPTPEFAGLLSGQCEQLLDRLHDESLREIALMKLGGHTDGEIANQLGCALRTVQRKLSRIRAEWEESVNG
jgi:DNA-directed RNA polymerase specialized sigma24 family protein